MSRSCDICDGDVRPGQYYCDRCQLPEEQFNHICELRDRLEALTDKHNDLCTLVYELKAELQDAKARR